MASNEVMGILVSSSGNTEEEMHTKAADQMFKGPIIVVFGLLAYAVSIITAQALIYYVRIDITKKLARRIFGDKLLYDLVIADQRIDNFDQRLTEDLGESHPAVTLSLTSF